MDGTGNGWEHGRGARERAVRENKEERNVKDEEERERIKKHRQCYFYRMCKSMFIYVHEMCSKQFT